LTRCHEDLDNLFLTSHVNPARSWKDLTKILQDRLNYRIPCMQSSFILMSAKIVKINRKPPNKIASFSIVDDQLASVLTLGQGFSFG
jgi:hypothetical protein